MRKDLTGRSAPALYLHPSDEIGRLGSPGGRAVSAGTSARTRPFTVVMAMQHLGFLRNFETVAKLLCASGVDVHVYCSRRHKTITDRDYDLPQGGPGRLRITIADTDIHQVTSRRLRQIRVLRDILQYARPEYRDAVDLQERFIGLQRKLFRDSAIEFLAKASAAAGAPLRALADRMLAWLDGLAGPCALADGVIETLRPDLLVVTPLVDFDSREVEVVKAARRRGIPTMLAVASWDNLTNKGRMKVKPDRVVVWNQHMLREARELHGIPEDRISIVGSAVFDAWFDRQASRSRADFCRFLGLDPAKPIIVYLCSTFSIAGKGEYQVIEQWMRALRGADDDVVAGANVLVRPHPMAVAPWTELLGKDVDKATTISAIVWPVRATHPTSESGRADFYDTMYHADAVVGLNTSAMIEAAILHKPVLTFVNHDAAQGQTANLHFKYLAESGCVILSTTWDEHILQLSKTLRGCDFDNVCDRFVQDFVRPLGRQQSSSALLARQMLEMLADEPQR